MSSNSCTVSIVLPTSLLFQRKNQEGNSWPSEKMGISTKEEHCNLSKRVMFKTLKGFPVLG